jgi:hypothetical protein
MEFSMKLVASTSSIFVAILAVTQFASVEAQADNAYTRVDLNLRIGPDMDNTSQSSDSTMTQPQAQPTQLETLVPNRQIPDSIRSTGARVLDDGASVEPTRQ